MLAILTRKEILEHCLSLRFALNLGLGATVLAAAIGIRGLEYTQIQREKQNGDTIYHNQITPQSPPWLLWLPGVYANRPLNPLQIFVQGTPPTFAGTIRAHAWERDEAHYRPAYSGQGLEYLFAEGDLVFFVGTLMSLMAIVFSYDSVCGERQQGTLKLLLSYNVGHHQLLLAKWLGGLLALAAPLVLGVFAGLLLTLEALEFSPGADLFGLLPALAGFALLYLSLFLLAGIAVSSLVPRPGTALLALLLLWIFSVLGWPNLAPYLAAATRPAPSPYVLEKTKHQIQLEGRRDVADKMWAWRQTHPNAPEEDYWQYYKKTNQQHYDAIGKQRRQAETNFRRQLEAQVKLAQALGRLSPLTAFAESAANLAGSGAEAHWRFFDQLQKYHQALIQFLDQIRAQNLTKPDISVYPRFAYPLPSFTKRLEHTFLDLLLLVGWNGVLFLAAHRALLRSQIA